MDHLELKSAVRRLHKGECPICGNNLSYLLHDSITGKMEKNGMCKTSDIMQEKRTVYCEVCGYSNDAIQIGLTLIPVDRLSESDERWDEPYLSENVLIYGKTGENPFNKKGKD